MFSWKQGKVRIVRNHEQTQPNPVGVFGDVSHAYDPAAPGGTTTGDLSDRRRGQQLGEPQRHDFQLCRWRQPVGDLADLRGDPEWGGPATQLPDRAHTTRTTSSYTEKHGYLFEVPVSRDLVPEVAEPILSAGRFADEAAAVDPTTGDVYMTEDDFAYASGFYRYRPLNSPNEDKRIADGGVLEILGVIPPGASEPVTMDLHTGQAPGTTYQVGWIPIEDPDPEFEDGLSNDEAARVVFQEGESNGAARFSRLEGMDYFEGKIFFVSTEGGGPFDSDPPPNGSAGFGRRVWPGLDVRHLSRGH